MADSIRLITFKTNHTILGKVTEKLNTVVVKKPVQVIVVPPRSENDSGAIAFSPFLEYTLEFGTGLEFNNDDILVITTPVVELENRYNSLFGSGITIAKSIPNT